MPSFEEHQRFAAEVRFAGWDWSVFAGHLASGRPSWDFAAQLRSRSGPSLLDLGTGGGEFLRSLAPLPPTVATEGWAPNMPVAAATAYAEAARRVTNVAERNHLVRQAARARAH